MKCQGHYNFGTKNCQASATTIVHFSDERVFLLCDRHVKRSKNTIKKTKPLSQQLKNFE